MGILVQRPMAGRFEKRESADAVWAVRSLGCVIVVLWALGHSVCLKGAKELSGGQSDSGAKEAGDPNERGWSRWDAVGADPNDPGKLLEAKWNAVVKVLQSRELDPELKKKIIDKIMSPIFDSELMAKLALGRTHWAKLTASEQASFTELFAERLKSFYLEKTTLYKNEQVLFKSAMQKKNAVHIPMVLISNDQEAAILYKLHRLDEAGRSQENASWKIYDVEIEGISILLTYRSQFDDILNRGSVKELFDQLEKPPTQ